MSLEAYRTQVHSHLIIAGGYTTDQLRGGPVSELIVECKRKGLKAAKAAKLISEVMINKGTMQ
jgi:hypothetical protein